MWCQWCSLLYKQSHWSTNRHILQRKVMKILRTNLKWKTLDYRIMLMLISCYLHPYLINISIWNTILNIITPSWMVKHQHQTTNQLIHRLLHLLIKQMKKYVHYKVQYAKMINYSENSKSQARAVRRTIDIIKTHI